MESSHTVPVGQTIDGYALARRMGILRRPFLVDFDVASEPWSWRKDRYSARQLGALWRERLAKPGLSPEFPVGFYMHVPFCTHSCSFCRCFRMQLKSGRSLLDRYADYVCDQLDFFAPTFAGTPIRYFSVGGGTPSLLPAAHWRRIFAKLRERYDMQDDSPLSTFEMSLPTVRDDILDALVEGKVPRVSIGVQTLSPEIRTASKMFAIAPERLAERVAAARGRGLHVNLDLVLGLPDESAAAFVRGFKTVLAMKPSSVCVNILGRNYFDPAKGAPGTPEYLKAVGEGMAAAAEKAGYVAYPHANHLEAIVFLSKSFEKAAKPHWDVLKRLASGILSVRVGTSVFAFGSVCNLALPPDSLISCFDQDYEFDPDKVAYQCSRREVFHLIYPKEEDIGPAFDAGQLRLLKPALERLRVLPGLEVMPSLDDVLLEFPDSLQEDKRGRVFIRPFAEGKPCAWRVGPFALTYNGVESSVTAKVMAAAGASLGRTR